MRMNTAVGTLFTCVAALLLTAVLAVPAFAAEGQTMTVAPEGSTLTVTPEEVIETSPPTIAEREQAGPKAIDSSKEAISQAATRVATPERARTAKEATIAVTGPASSTSLSQTGDALMEGTVVAAGGVVIVAFCLLLYYFRRA